MNNKSAMKAFVRPANLFVAFLLCCAALFAPQTASALIEVGQGNAPVADAGWPNGALALANMKCRVGWWEGPPFGGGQSQFLYRGDNELFNQALTGFTAIRTPALDLVIHDGPYTNGFLTGERRVDWSFTVWVPASWHQLYNNPQSHFGADLPGYHQPVDPPRLDVYVGSGGLDWSKVKVPANVHVRDERDSASGVTPIGGGLVRVDVYDMATGKPVPRAHVNVEAADAQSGTYHPVAGVDGDDAGHLEVTAVPAGSHRITIEAPNYAARVLGYEIFTARTVKKYTVELSKVSTIRGIVVDNDGTPVEKARVTTYETMAIDGHGYKLLNAPEAATDATGAFELSGLPTGFTQLQASLSGYSFEDPFAVHEVPATNIVLHLSRAAKLKVTIVDKKGAPLAAFEGNPLIVDIEPKDGPKVGTWSGSTTVKPDGTIEFENIPAGQYRINSRPNPANTDKHYTPEQMVEVKPGPQIVVKMVYE